MNMKRSICVFGWAALTSGAAWATPLLPGGIQYKTHPSVPPGPLYTTTLPPFAGGGNEVGSLNAPMTGEFFGTVSTHVYRDPANSFLSFDYQFSMTDANTAAVVRATMNGWLGVSISDTGANASGNSGTFDPHPEWTDGDPLFIGRDEHSEGLEFQWRQAIGGSLIGTVIGPGDVSSHIFVVTNMTQFTTGQVDMIDTAVTGQANVLVPQIPEPTCLMLVLAGAAAMAIRRR